MAFRTYRAAIRYHADAREMVAVYHFGGDDAIADFTPLTAQGLADKLAGGGLVDAYRNLLDTGDVLDDVTVTQMLPADSTATPDGGLAAVAAAGHRTWATELPMQMCGLVTHKTGVPRRYARGWSFLPPIRRVADIDSMQIKGTEEYWLEAAALVTELGHWNKGGSTWSGGSWGIGVYSRHRDDAHLSNFFFHHTAHAMTHEVHWLRSRAA